jgi:hypothetical protein
MGKGEMNMNDEDESLEDCFNEEYSDDDEEVEEEEG